MLYGTIFSATLLRKISIPGNMTIKRTPLGPRLGVRLIGVSA